MLDPGTPAPPFVLPDQDGDLVASASLSGGWVLLWWYPKAGTPGCTVEGQELRDRTEDFATAGCAILGLSFDTPTTNKIWADAQGFGFRLLSDRDHRIGRAYEVEREADDQYAAFPLRVSYLVDPDGIIRKAYAVSGVADHATAVLETLARGSPEVTGPRWLKIVPPKIVPPKTVPPPKIATPTTVHHPHPHPHPHPVPVAGFGSEVVLPPRISIERRAVDPASDAAELAGRVAQVDRGGARAAVLGVNDGLVTNVCLILAVAGAHASAASVRLAGFASLLAGCFSMAAGEWVSVRSQVELYVGLLGEVRRLVARNPRLVLDKLSGDLEGAGFGRATAQTAAAEVALDEDRFLAFTARTVFGINPDGLGSPLTAAFTSLTYFAGGALVPLMPWFFIGGRGAEALSIGLTAIASLIVGGVVARSSDRPIRLGALRQLAIVLAAAAITYSVGRLFGATVG